MPKLTITVRKSDPVDDMPTRGAGWYYLVNGVKDGRTLSDVGGDDHYSSEKKAREAAKIFVGTCYFDPKWGWCCK